MRHVPYAYPLAVMTSQHHLHQTNPGVPGVPQSVNRCFVHFLTKSLPLVFNRDIVK